MIYKLETTIPVAQYGNMRQTFEPDEGQDLAEFQEEAMKTIHDVWDKYGEKPLSAKVTAIDKGMKIKSFTGEDLMYNDHTHVYTDMEGNKILSGSQYAKAIMPEFNKDAVIPACVKAWGVDGQELGEVWDFAGDVSTSYGTSIHKALEAYHKFKGLGDVVLEKKKNQEFNYALPKNKHIRDIVLSFEKQFGVDAQVELLVSDVKNLRAGQIDRLQILDKDKKVCRIGDYKTNAELDKNKILGYQHQLSFYAHILMADGWTVEGLDIFHLEDDWTRIELEVLDLQ